MSHSIPVKERFDFKAFLLPPSLSLSLLPSLPLSLSHLVILSSLSPQSECGDGNDYEFRGEGLHRAVCTVPFMVSVFCLPSTDPSLLSAHVIPCGETVEGKEKRGGKEKGREGMREREGGREGERGREGGREGRSERERGRE